LIGVRLAQLQVSGGRIGPVRRRRGSLLEHGQRQPGAAGRGPPPHVLGGGELSPGPPPPPPRPRPGPTPRLSPPPPLGRPAHPPPAGGRGGGRAGVGAGGGGEGAPPPARRPPPPAGADENRRLARGAPGYPLGRAREIGGPRRDRASQVGDAHLVAAPGQVSR